jgi:glycosyltransferase involved in cell wall biosynthesis
MTMPLAELGRHDGYDVTFADAGDDGHPPLITGSMLEGYDVITAQRWNKHDGLSVWRRARGPFSRLVYETDDDLFSVTPENWNAYHLYNQPGIQDAVTHAAETADLVTVSTEPLAQVMREVAGHDRVAVLPNAIPPWVTALPRHGHLRPRVGWQGGASHGVDIGQVASPVRRFLKRFPGWDLQLNGQDYRLTFADAGVPEDRMFHVGWVPVYDRPEQYYASIDFDIGLAPLWPTKFSASKSAIKAIEYGGRGIPTIASYCAAYRGVIEHGVNGFLVRHDHEWLKYLSELAGDDALREKMGAAALEMAGRHLITEHWTAWRDAYESMFRPAGKLPHGRRAEQLYLPDPLFRHPEHPRDLG